MIWELSLQAYEVVPVKDGKATGSGFNGGASVKQNWAPLLLIHSEFFHFATNPSSKSQSDWQTTNSGMFSMEERYHREKQTSFLGVFRLNFDSIGWKSWLATHSFLLNFGFLTALLWLSCVKALTSEESTAVMTAKSAEVLNKPSLLGIHRYEIWASCSQRLNYKITNNYIM